MGSSDKVHPANGTDNADQGPSAQDRKLLDLLAKLWKSQAASDLGARHRTGTLLNERLGAPTARQSHGRRVLKLVAEKLGIAESDLNRMRWLSHLFVDLASLRQSHPEIDSWTKFKAALPSLKPVKGDQARKPVADPPRPALGGVVKSLANLTSKLNGLDIRPEKAEKEKFLTGLRELAKAASSRFKINVEVTVGVKASKPVATKRVNGVT